MFEQFFTLPRTVAHHWAGPLLEERLRYLQHLAGQGLARWSLATAARYLLRVAVALRLADRPGEVIDLAEIDQQANLWANRLPQRQQRRRSRAYYHFRQHAHGWLHFLGRLQLPVLPSNPYAGLIEAFADFQCHSQGLAAQTIERRCRQVQDFLGRLGISPQAFHEITLSQVDAILADKVRHGRYARISVCDLASTLRAFFRYAEQQGWCRAGLAAGIQGPRLFPQETLPAGPSWEEVRRLLALTAGDRPTDIRDRPLLLLFAVYGFRAGEVVRLRLEDFDWERELLHITRSKTGQPQTYPLTRTLGNAVLRYVREVRPRCTCRAVFLTRYRPYRPLSRTVLWSIVSCRLRSLGVSLRHCGPHALRFACATHLLEQGLSLKEIGDHLGHQQPKTTQRYTKVDITGLRQVGDFDLGDLL
jgi:site-specific recombinase XerD